MCCIDFIWLLLIFGHIAEADHFRGGTITWKPVYNNVTTGGIVSIMITQTYCWTLSQIGCNDTMITAQSPVIDTGTRAGSGINLLCNASCSTSGGYVGQEPPITGPCIDYSTALNLTVSQRSDIVNITVGAYFTVTFGTGGGWPILALGSSAGWSISSLINLQTRPDNGLINTPPVATCISYISIPVSVQQTIQIPVLDADNDFIRCRFSNGTSECLNTCPPTSLPSGTTLTSSCSLTITGIAAGDYYLVAMQVEDFITNVSTIPLSSVPLQFLIYVYATPNCTLEPLLTANVNNNNCQPVQVGVSFTMTFTAINRCGSGQPITDIATLSFPIITKSVLLQSAGNTSLWSMNITWTPTANQVGSQVLCAVASDSASVQSDQYCIRFSVGLSSTSLCPGVTVAPTTMMITTMQTSVMTSTVPITTHDSTVLSTTMVSTSSSIVTTSTSTTSAVTSSSVKSENKVNWPLIIGLSLLALALALCCLLSWCYCLPRFRANRRRKSKDQQLGSSLDWFGKSENTRRKLLKRSGQTPDYELDQTKNITMTSDSRTPSRATTIRTDLFINDKENRTNQQSARNSPDSFRQFKSGVSAKKSDQRSRMSRSLGLNDPIRDSVAQDISDLSTVSAPISTKTKTSSVHIVRILRSSKSPTRSCQSAVTSQGQQQRCRRSSSIEPQKTTAEHKRISSVTVSRVRRSSSAGQQSHTHQRITTAPSNHNLSNVTVIKSH